MRPYPENIKDVEGENATTRVRRDDVDVRAERTARQASPAPGSDHEKPS
jgi:hypothetical protein